VFRGASLTFSANGMSRFSSAGASPDKGDALAFVSIRSLGFFFPCGTEVIDREISVADATKLVADTRPVSNQSLSETPARSGWGSYSQVRDRSR
jgi:hypothetical protein